MEMQFYLLCQFWYALQFIWITIVKYAVDKAYAIVEFINWLGGKKNNVYIILYQDVGYHSASKLQ